MPRGRFITRSTLAARFEGKRVAIVGSGPGVLENEPGFIDSHDVVVRVNNYRIVMPATGTRTDVFYSFFGKSIHKTARELQRHGVTLCVCKCPNAIPIESEWHRQNKKMNGVDFRRIYMNRSPFWFCDTYIPEVSEFLADFNLLGGHVPTTGFAAIRLVLTCAPKSIFLTGFDFFRSGIHNVTDPWRAKHTDDPIGHQPEREFTWLIDNLPLLPVTTDQALTRMIASPLLTAGGYQVRPSTLADQAITGAA